MTGSPSAAGGWNGRTDGSLAASDRTCGDAIGGSVSQTGAQDGIHE